MKAVRIADLKSHLSQHLRDVRAGNSVTILDRETPVARLLPIDSGDDVTITSPAKGAAGLASVKLPRPVKIKVDAVRFLLEDRRKRG